MTFCFVVVVLPIVIVVVNATFSFGKRCWLGKDPLVYFWWFGFGFGGLVLNNLVWNRLALEGANLLFSVFVCCLI